jgi:CRP-like cAMP-binding protein
MSTKILLAKLESIAELTDEQRLAISALKGEVRELKRGEDIAPEGSAPQSSTLVLNGLLARYKWLPEGGRQIVAFHTPGDIPDLHSLFIRVMDHSLGAISASRVLLIRHEVLRDAIRATPLLGEVLWRDTLIDAAIFREWTVNVGSRSAYKRIAHMLCEVMARMKAVGLSDGQSCLLPVTQEDIADATGLSAVHVNRTLQELRGEGLLEIGKGALSVHSWSRLQEAGDFNPAYLHMRAA